MSHIPSHFLFRLAYPCLYQKNIPLKKGDGLLDLPERCIITHGAAMSGAKPWAEVRTGWNERGIGISLTVKGKDQPVQGGMNRTASSDGLILWMDTRDVRDSHRASRYCHCFLAMATGGGEDEDEPFVMQQKIHRALADAPIHTPESFAIQRIPIKSGYRLEVFLPSECLNGFDVEVNARLGFFYLVRDSELGSQSLSHGPEFPFAEDPSLWQMLELIKT